LPLGVDSVNGDLQRVPLHTELLLIPIIIEDFLAFLLNKLLPNEIYISIICFKDKVGVVDIYDDNNNDVVGHGDFLPRLVLGS